MPGVKTQKITYTKRDRAAYDQLRTEFDNGVQSDFLKRVAGDSAQAAKLRGAGLTDAQINAMKAGTTPKGFQVHHKLPLDDGGTNDFDNLALVQTNPYHMAFNSYQASATYSLNVGDSMKLDWPMPQSSVVNLGQ